MIFEQWFTHEDRGWWKENSRREDFEPLWERMKASGFNGIEIDEIFEAIIDAMHDEYGD